MKNFTKTFSLLLLFIAGNYLSYGQAQLGNGTDTSQELPFSAHHNNSYGQSIYLASEIGTGGEITSLQWYYNGAYAFQASDVVTIALGNTTKSAFTSLTDWETDENLTQIYQGNLTASSPGWITITLATPFYYNGTDNLVVAFKKEGPQGGLSSDKFFNTQVATNRSLVNFCSFCETAVGNSNPAHQLTNYVPNIILGNIDLGCPAPIVFIDDIGATSVLLNWTQPSSPSVTQNEYYISETNIAPTGDMVTGTLETGEITDLEINTTYYVWVRNNCTDDLVGSWSLPTMFTTTCGVMEAFYEDFEAADINALPVCWSAIINNGNSPNAYVKTQSGHAKSGTKSLHMINSDSAEDANIILVSPNVGDAINTHRLKFSAKGLPAGAIQIGTLNGSDPLSDFTFFTEQAITNVHTEYIIDFATYTGDDTHIGFRMKTATPYTNVFLDDIRWEVTPPCMDVAALEVLSTSQTTATLGWDPGEGLTEWNIVYGSPSDTDPDALLSTLVEVNNDPSGTLTALTPNTNYKAWIRSVCSGGTGVWIGPIAFTTPCDAVNEIDENFDSATNPLLPSCWRTIIRTTLSGATASIVTDSSDPHSGTNAIKINTLTTNTATDDVILVMPALGNVAAGTHRLKFFAKDNGTGSLQIVTLNNSSANAEFTVFKTLYTTGTYTEYKVDFTTYEGTDTYIGFRNTFGPYEDFLIDDVKWEPAPACPDATDVNYDAITAETATISWNSSIEAASWDVVFDTASDTDPATLALQNVLSKEATLTDLTENTPHYIWIRSNCGEEVGEWNGPFSFSTACQAVTSLNEGFEDIGNELPSCWSAILRGNTLSGEAMVVNYDSDAITGTHSVLLYNDPNYVVDDLILVTPYLSNIASGTGQLKFNSYQVSFLSTPTIIVGTLNNNSSTATFTPFEEIVIADAAEEYNVDFSSYSGTDPYIAFRFNTGNEGSGMIFIDDVTWDSDLGTKEHTAPSIRFYPNPVTDVLTLSGTQELTGVSVYNLLGQKVLETVLNTTSAQMDLSALATGSYMVKVTSNNETSTLKIIKK